jgi:hypothetical protein
MTQASEGEAQGVRRMRSGLRRQERDDERPEERRERDQLRIGRSSSLLLPNRDQDVADAIAIRPRAMPRA